MVIGSKLGIDVTKKLPDEDFKTLLAANDQNGRAM